MGLSRASKPILEILLPEDYCAIFYLLRIVYEIKLSSIIKIQLCQYHTLLGYSLSTHFLLIKNHYYENNILNGLTSEDIDYCY